MVVLAGVLVFFVAATVAVYASKPRAYWFWLGASASASVVSLLLLACAGLVCCSFGPAISQSVRPETVEQARNHDVSMMGVPLPDSAKNVQYAFVSQGIALLELVRFEAPLQDCRAVAEQLVAKYNTLCPDREISGLRQLNTGPRLSWNGSDLLWAPWFTPQTIRSGLVAGEHGNRKPIVWIDMEQRTFYYLRTD